MNSRPLISVITVCRNAEAAVATTVRNVASQSFGDFEHILIDGASTDSTLDAARAQASPRLRILSEPDKGIYDAMNKGMRLAKGEYIIFMNAGDTFADSGSLRKYADAIEKHNPDIIYGDTMLMDAGGKLIGPRHLSPPELLTADSYRNGMLVCHQAFMARKSIAPQFDTSYRFSADYLWSLQCIASTTPGKCVYLRSVVAHYLRGGETTRNLKASLKERFRIMCSWYGTVPTLCRHLAFAMRFIRRRKSGSLQ